MVTSEYNVSPGGIPARVTIDFDDGMQWQGDLHELNVNIRRDEWPLVKLEMHVLKVTKNGEERSLDDLVRVIRFKEDDAVRG